MAAGNWPVKLFSASTPRSVPRLTKNPYAVTKNPYAVSMVALEVAVC